MCRSDSGPGRNGLPRHGRLLGCAEGVPARGRMCFLETEGCSGVQKRFRPGAEWAFSRREAARVYRNASGSVANGLPLHRDLPLCTETLRPEAEWASSRQRPALVYRNALARDRMGFLDAEACPFVQIRFGPGPNGLPRRGGLPFCADTLAAWRRVGFLDTEACPFVQIRFRPGSNGLPRHRNLAFCTETSRRRPPGEGRRGFHQKPSDLLSKLIKFRYAFCATAILRRGRLSPPLKILEGEASDGGQAPVLGRPIF